jgi:Fe-S cluster biosynthesis and repair protein YggX
MLKMIPNIHYRNPTLCRVPESLGSAIYSALDKTDFTECYTRHKMALREERLCREQNSRHKKALSKNFFAECSVLGKNGLSAKRR